MESPSQSPDLNPIENIWGILKANLSKRKRKPHNTDEVWVQVQEEWARLKDELLGKLAKSMITRCQQVLDAKGGPLHY